MNDLLRNAATCIAPPIVASPAKRIQAFTGDPDFMASLARGLAAWMARASTSLPVPLSPRISTLASVAATMRASATRSAMRLLR